MDEQIKITAEPLSTPNMCKFTVDRSVYPGEAAYFPGPKKAKGSPLAEKLFEIDNVATVLIADDTITIAKASVEEWPVIGGQIGAAIRAHLKSGLPAVSEKVKADRPSEERIREGVQQVLETEINPSVAAHGGMVSLIDVKGNTVYLELGGGCQGCGMADVTLRGGVDHAIRSTVPEVGEILDTTDHASGKNPYYAPSKK